jgi:predicted dehydrogenase
VSAEPLRVGIVGCGFIGTKRAEALGGDRLVACFDTDAGAARTLAEPHDASACPSLHELLELDLDVVVVAVTHDQLAPAAICALQAGANVVVEKPAALGVAQVEAIADAAGRAGKLARVGFQHRFYPALVRVDEIVRSGRFGDVMFLRARYGHGGRIGYDREWRMDPERSGGGELVDQGMHLIDLTHWLMGPLPLHSALLRTNYWDAAVEDNAALLLGEPGDPHAPWATLHATWTEWKNLFSLEVYCRTGKLSVDGLAKSYGPQRLAVYAMKPGLGPPDAEHVDFPPQDTSWQDEWRSIRDAVAGGDTGQGDLESARYAWGIVEEAYRRNGYPLNSLAAQGSAS